jgi:uncharacterized damage-inducible protein DinB
MTHSLTDNYRRWFDYEKDSHAKVLSSLATVPAEARSSESFQKAVDLLAHIAAARRMWLFRFGVAGDNADLFPRKVAWQDLPELIGKMEAAWSDYLSSLDDAELGRVFEYTSYEGARFRGRVEDILTQLFGHSLYHRGQIASLVRAMGGEPAVTDFVFWSREPV